jgi:hypothetical protein
MLLGGSVHTFMNTVMLFLNQFPGFPPPNPQWLISFMFELLISACVVGLVVYDLCLWRLDNLEFIHGSIDVGCF